TAEKLPPRSGGAGIAPLGEVGPHRRTPGTAERPVTARSPARQVGGLDPRAVRAALLSTGRRNTGLSGPGPVDWTQQVSLSDQGGAPGPIFTPVAAACRSPVLELPVPGPLQRRTSPVTYDAGSITVLEGLQAV